MGGHKFTIFGEVSENCHAGNGQLAASRLAHGLATLPEQPDSPESLRKGRSLFVWCAAGPKIAHVYPPLFPGHWPGTEGG